MEITVKNTMWLGEVMLVKVYDGKEGRYLNNCSKCKRDYFADKRDVMCPYCNKFKGDKAEALQAMKG